MGELIMKLLHASTAAHVLHLKTRSYAAHVALNELYEALPDFADRLAETYQGRHGLIETYPARYTAYSDAMELIKDLADWVMDNRFEVAGKTESCVQNIIDELLAQLSVSEYKLRFLK